MEVEAEISTIEMQWNSEMLLSNELAQNLRTDEQLQRKKKFEDLFTWGKHGQKHR